MTRREFRPGVCQQCGARSSKLSAELYGRHPLGSRTVFQASRILFSLWELVGGLLVGAADLSASSLTTYCTRIRVGREAVQLVYEYCRHCCWFPSSNSSGSNTVHSASTSPSNYPAPYSFPVRPLGADLEVLELHHRSATRARERVFRTCLVSGRTTSYTEMRRCHFANPSFLTYLACS